MQKETRTAQFAGKEYHFVVYDAEAIREVKGMEAIKGFADNTDGAAHASWWSFEDEADVRTRHWNLTPEDLVLDIGPAFGSYSLTAAIQGARVYAFEPCEFCRNMLVANVAMNDGMSDQVTIIQVGAYDRQGFVDPDSGDFSESAFKDGRQSLRVRPVDSFAFATGTNRVTMVKMDVEGAELHALRGMEKTLRAHRPRLLIEEHEFKQAGIGNEVEKFLRELGIGYQLVQREAYHSVAHGYYEAR